MSATVGPLAATPPVAAGTAAVAVLLVVAAPMAAPAPAPATPTVTDGLGDVPIFGSPNPPSAEAPGIPAPSGKLAPGAGTKPGVCGDTPGKDGVVNTLSDVGSDGAPAIMEPDSVVAVAPARGSSVDVETSVGKLLAKLPSWFTPAVASTPP